MSDQMTVSLEDVSPLIEGGAISGGQYIALWGKPLG